MDAVEVTVRSEGAQDDFVLPFADDAMSVSGGNRSAKLWVRGREAMGGSHRLTSRRATPRAGVRS
jgi:hypothetical protein